MGKEWTLKVGRLDGLVHRLDRDEAQAAIKPHGAGILGRHFQVDTRDAGAVKAFQRLVKQCRAQAAVAIFGGNSQVLDGAKTGVITNSLDRAASHSGPRLVRHMFHQPRRRREEAGFLGNLAHQPTTAGQFT